VTETAGSGPAADTTDLREGPPIHDDLLALVPLVGLWGGAGIGVVPETGAEFRFVQALTFAHDGRPFLVYESHTWLLDETGAVSRAAARESGFWRPGAGPDDVEVVLALNTGVTLVLTGSAGDARWSLETTALDSTPTAKNVDGNRRLYAVTAGEDGDELAYAQELARVGEDFRPHLNARLQRR
jgi:THAP4-like, heme-binding beta-barrel domain